MASSITAFYRAYCLTAAWLPLAMSLSSIIVTPYAFLVRSDNSHVECLSKDISRVGRERDAAQFIRQGEMKDALPSRISR